MAIRVDWTVLRRGFRETKAIALALIAAGGLAVAAPYVALPPPSPEKQCDVAIELKKHYTVNAPKTAADRRILADAERELDECMRQ